MMTSTTRPNQDDQKDDRNGQTEDQCGDECDTEVLGPGPLTRDCF